MCECKLTSLFRVLVVFSAISVTYSFNIEIFNYAVYSRPNGMFGFTVAVHKQHNRGSVLVGSPEATSIHSPVQNGGAVYKCRTDADDVCTEIPFDTQPNHRFTNNATMDDKNGQWFGATLSTAGTGPVVACAPRYVWFSLLMNRRDPVGTCYVGDGDFSTFEEYSPCRTSNYGYHRQGSCQAGFSAAINSAGDRLYVGAPGSFYWQGQMYSVDAHARFEYTPGRFTQFGGKGAVHQQSLETRPAVFSTREGRQQDDDSYMGYSTIVGDFLGTGEEGVAVGMPRGASLYGKVLLFTWNLTNYKNITSNQLGSYFGYALAAADVDGDKLLDLIIGAPMHTVPNTAGKFDVGRVYVFYQKAEGGVSFNKSTILDGINSKSRFGHSLARLGDLNKDGYEDFAVGAPYDGENGNGAVYIFYGSKNGVLEKFGQVIYAENLRSAVPISTFGFSLAGGIDLDDNEYPDMAVGAYESNSAWFFRSRPVVLVDSFVRFHSESKKIDIKQKNCILPNGRPGTCTKIDFCIKYTGEGVPPQIDFDLEYNLDTKVSHNRRMGFLRHSNSSQHEKITLYKDSPTPTCMTEEVYIKEEIRDKLTQLEAEVKYKMLIKDSSLSSYRDPRSQLLPVLDLNLPPSRRDSIVIQKNCGFDNVCIPDLRIQITRNVEKYLLGSDTNLEFDVIVSNIGEDSFETTFQMKYPEGVNYKKTEMSHGIFCKEKENRTVFCDIGNPLPANKIAKFKTIFQPKIQEVMSRSYEFEALVNSTNPENEKTLKDNSERLVIPIWVDSSLELGGKSFPYEIYSLNTSSQSDTIENEEDIGPLVTHLYTLKNKGPATIEAAEIYFLWPWQTLGGDDLLYLLDSPHIDGGNVKCDLLETANYKHYILNRYTDSIWKRLNIDQSSAEFTKSTSETLTGEKVKVEAGAPVTGVIGGPKKFKDTKLDQEIAKTSGDASLIYEKRQNVSESGILSSGNINQAGITISTKSEWVTQYINGKPYTKWTNVTTIRDSSGKILNTTYSTDNDSVGGFQNVYQQQNVNKGGPKIIYTSSGSAQQEGSSSDLSISGSSAHLGAAVEQPAHVTETYQHAYEQQGSYHRQETSGSSSNHQQQETGGFGQQQHTVVTTETPHHEEHVYEVGGGPREGGNHQVRPPSPSFAEEQERRRQEEIKRRQEAEAAETARLRYQEQLRQETLWRKQEEERRAQESRIKLDEQHRQQEKFRDEERRKQAEKARQDEWRKRQEEDRAQQEERRRLEEERVKVAAEEERRRQEDIRVRQQYEQRRQQAAAASASQGSYSEATGGSRHSYNRGGHVKTGYYDAQGVYHDVDDRVNAYEAQSSYNRTHGSGTMDVNAINIDHSRDGLGEVAAGNGFRVQTLDLGQFGSEGSITGNVQGGGHSSGDTEYDQEWQRRQDAAAVEDGGRSEWQSGSQRSSSGSFSGVAGEGDSYSRASGGAGGQRQEWSSGGQRTSSGTFSGTVGGQQSWERRSAGGVFPPHIGHNDIERDNVPTDRPDPSSVGRHRGRRQIIDPELDKLLKCVSTRCFSIKCNVGTLKKDELITIALRSRLDVRSVKNLTTTTPIKLSSMMVAKIVKLPHMAEVQPEDQVLHSHEVFTEIAAQEPETPPKVVPLWIILLSAIAGTLILLLVILLLYKCGFFRRNRPSSAPERQPLNRNGYHAGDEAL